MEEAISMFAFGYFVRFIDIFAMSYSFLLYIHYLIVYHIVAIILQTQRDSIGADSGRMSRVYGFIHSLCCSKYNYDIVQVPS